MTAPKKTPKPAAPGWTVAMAGSQLDATEYKIRQWIKSGRLEVISGKPRQGRTIRIRRVDPVTFQPPTIRRGRPARQTPVSDSGYVEAAIEYVKREIQSTTAKQMKELAADVCASYDKARTTMARMFPAIDGLRAWPGRGRVSGSKAGGFLVLAASARELAVAVDRLSMAGLSVASVATSSPEGWLGRGSTTDRFARMHVVQVLALAGASTAQIARELDISVAAVKSLKRRWRRGAWRRVAAADWLDRLDEALVRQGEAPLSRRRGLTR